jgi:hypothetical protein
MIHHDSINHFDLDATHRHSRKKRKLMEVQSEFETLYQRMLSCEEGSEEVLLSMILNDPSLARAAFPIMEHREQAYPLFHFAQAASLESVMILYSLYPKAIAYQTKSGYFPHHFAAGNRSDDVLRFLVFQYPKALSGRPSVFQMLIERIQSLPLLQFCLSQYPQGLYERCDSHGNTLLHIACNVHSFPYPGPRPMVIEYLMREFPQAAEMQNSQGNLPLHCLLDSTPLLTQNTIHTQSALLLLRRHPKSKEVPNHLGTLPLCMAMEAPAASVELITKLADLEHPLIPTRSPHVIAAHLLRTSQGPSLVQAEIWDSACPLLAKAVSSILNQNLSKFTELTICFTRIERTGLCLILQSLENNTHIEHCNLSANVGFYNQKLEVNLPEYPPYSLYCVDKGGSLASDFDFSMSLHALFQNNSTLVAIDLSDNQLPKNPTYLFPLMSNRTLKCLSLARTNIGNSILQAMIPIIRQNKTITDINLSCPSISESCILDLLHVVPESKSLKRLILYRSTPSIQERIRCITKQSQLPDSSCIVYLEEGAKPSCPILLPSTKDEFVSNVLALAPSSMQYSLLRNSVSIWAPVSTSLA